MFLSQFKRANSRSTSYSFKKIKEILIQHGIKSYRELNIKTGIIFEFECNDAVVIDAITQHIRLVAGRKFNFARREATYFKEGDYRDVQL